ncbi:MAG: elongation factor [Verrucomicrobiota bacterium]|jgi:elongation factor P
MATFGVEDLKKGLRLKIDGKPYLITEFEFKKPGKGQAVYRCRVKDLITGNTFEKVWRSGDNFETADLESLTVNYSYENGDDFAFIDQNSSEEIVLTRKQLEDKWHFLTDDAECELLLFEGKVIDVTLPTWFYAELTTCEPGVRGDTANNVTKPAFTKTGWEIRVPLFLNQGDWVKIDTRTGEYVERVANPNDIKKK